MNLLKILFLFLYLITQPINGQNNITYLFVGTYTEEKPDKGIYVYKFDSKTGQLKLVSHAENLTNSSYITMAPNGRCLYACTDTRMSGKGGVMAFAFDSAIGKLAVINRQPAGGENPVYLTMDAGNKFVGNANGDYHAFGILTGDVLGKFKTSVLSVSDDVFNTKLSEFLAIHADKLKIISGVTIKPLTIVGKIVNFSRTKVNTILGRYDPDMKDLFNELGNYKNVGLGEKNGCINILNKPNQYGINPSTGKNISVEDWWNIWNKTWLEKVVNRGDDIYLATIHAERLQVMDKLGNLKGSFAYELRYLVQRNFKPINITEKQWEIYKTWFN